MKNIGKRIKALISLYRGPKRVPAAIVTAVLLLAIVVLLVLRIRSGHRYPTGDYGDYVPSEEVVEIIDHEEQGIGTVYVSTMAMPDQITPLSAQYTPSGRVLVDYALGSNHILCTMDDDGKNVRDVYLGKLPSHYILRIFADNSRILIGDQILECLPGQTLDTCEEYSMTLTPLEYPGELVNSSAVTEKWTNVVVSPDGEHVAWTMTRKDVGDLNVLGVLTRTDEGYRIDGAQVITTQTPYERDEADSQILEPLQIRGGDLAQFIRGGTSLSMAGLATNGMPESVAQDIATGEVTPLTNHAGFDGITMVSPNEVYGITMSTRFSTSTDLGALGFVPRPRGDVLQSILPTMQEYCIESVKANQRRGNLGPVLINMNRSGRSAVYRGISLVDTDDTNWICLGCLSWNDDSSKCMWMERRKTGKGVRVRIAKITRPSTKAPVEADKTPRAGDYADPEKGESNLTGTVLGPVSGEMTISRTRSLLGQRSVTVSYVNYTEDGSHFYNGLEVAKFSLGGTLVYTSSISVTDPEGETLGSMDIRVEFDSHGSLSTTRNFGSSTWENATLDLTGLSA